jgi:molecular chaperone GrpE
MIEYNEDPLAPRPARPADRAADRPDRLVSGDGGRTGSLEPNTAVTAAPASAPDAGQGGGAAAPAAEAADAARLRDEYYDLLLRKTAEFENYRKRVERERRELSDYTVGEFVRELLPILDDFGRAIAADERSGGAFRQGVELIHKRLLDVLARRGVSIIDPLGETFDPHLHEAVARVAADHHRDGEIVEVFSRGYKLGDRLLRPAMVKVATA